MIAWACAILVGAALGAITAALLTFLAGVFPIRERPCPISDYHHRKDVP